MTKMLRPISALACLAALSQGAPAQTPSTQNVPLNIDARKLARALIQLTEQSGMQLIYPAGNKIVDLPARPLSGSFTPQAGLEQLLKGSGLKYEFLDARTIAIIDPAAEPLSTPEERQGPAKREGEDSARATAAETRSLLEKISWRVAQNATAATSVSENKNDPESPYKDSKREELQEIIVTAQKRAERSIDVPMSVTAISAEKLAAAGTTNILDLSRTVPGLSVTEQGPGYQYVAIRGISSYRGNSSLTGIYLDEMPLSGTQQGGFGSADLRVIDLDRVEVLKGPQGTLFGEGAAGGVIRFITKDPDLKRVGGELAAQFSNTTDGGTSERVTGAVEVPLKEDVFGIRVAGVYENSSGWIDQPSVGRKDINDSELEDVRVKALYRPIPQLQIKGLVELHRNQGGAMNMVNQQPYEDSIFLQPVFPDVSTDYFDDYDLYNATVTYDFGFAELLSSTSYKKANAKWSLPQLLGQAPEPWLEILIRDFALESSIRSQELRLTSATAGPFNWTLGAAYKDDESTFGLGYGVDINSRLLGGSIARASSSGFTPTNKSKSRTAFGDISYQLTQRFSLGGGLRYFNGEMERIEPGSFTAASTSSKVTYRAYGKFAASENVNAYLNVGTGFRSGGSNTPSLVPRGAPAVYGPENSIFYELGMKTLLLEGRIRFDAAAYSGKWNDMQQDVIVISPVDGDYLQYTSNGQSAEVKGVEAEISLAATDRLTFTLSGDVTDTKITWVDPANTAPNFFVGDPIDMVPDYKFSASAEYQFQWSPGMSGFFLLKFDQQGKSYSTARNNAVLPPELWQNVAPVVEFLSARVGGERSGWRWTLYGDNLLDERKPINAGYTGFSAQARPRTAGIIVSKSF